MGRPDVPGAFALAQERSAAVAAQARSFRVDDVLTAGATNDRRAGVLRAGDVRRSTVFARVVEALGAPI